MFYHIGGLAVGMLSARFSKCPRLRQRQLQIILASAAGVLFRDVPLITALGRALPAVIVPADRVSGPAAVQGRRKGP